MSFHFSKRRLDSSLILAKIDYRRSDLQIFVFENLPADSVN